MVAGVTDVQLLACLQELDAPGRGNPVPAVTRALVRAKAEDLVAVLGLIDDMGYVELARSPSGSITDIEITEAGRQRLVELRAAGGVAPRAPA